MGVNAVPELPRKVRVEFSNAPLSSNVLRRPRAISRPAGEQQAYRPAGGPSGRPSPADYAGGPEAHSLRGSRSPVYRRPRLRQREDARPSLQEARSGILPYGT